MRSKKYFFGCECRKYCKNPELIENYNKAIIDTENIWECHHKLEAFFTMKELIEMDRYYNVPARELIFVKNRKEHLRWPHKGKNIMYEKMKNKKLTEEHKEKISKSHTGKKHSKEHVEKLAKLHQKKVICIETGEIFESMKKASEFVKVSSGSFYSSVRKGYKAGGYHWKYFEEVNNE